MGLKDVIIKWQVKKYAKGCKRAMLFSALSFKEYYKEKPVSYSFIAKETLSTRPNWKQISENEFIFSKTNNSILITDEMSLKDVTDLVIAEELLYNLSGLSKSEYYYLLHIALEEANKPLRRRR